MLIFYLTLDADGSLKNEIGNLSELLNGELNI